MHPKTFNKQYKENLSNFLEWNVKVSPEKLVYPENFGPRMSIDETALSNGELYTIITNKDAKGKKGCLAAMIKGTKAQVVTEALEIVPTKILFAVEEVTLDLANSMDWIVRTAFPNAVLTADRFHFQKIVSEGVQEMRIRIRRKIIDDFNQKVLKARKHKLTYKPAPHSNGDTPKQLLARSRHLLFKPKSKWTKLQEERSKILFNEYPQLEKAYKSSMAFRNIFETTQDRESAKDKLKAWYTKLSLENYTEMISAANTIKVNEGKILNYFHSRSTNASAESFNAKLKGFRALLRGVRDINFFLFRVETLYA